MLLKDRGKSSMNKIKTLMNTLLLPNTMTSLLTTISESLEDLLWKLFPQKMPVGEVTCHTSPFNVQYNRMMCAYAEMKRKGATAEECSAFINNYKITSTEGQWHTQDVHYGNPGSRVQKNEPTTNNI